ARRLRSQARLFAHPLRRSACARPRRGRWGAGGDGSDGVRMARRGRVPPARRGLLRAADLRYRRQAYECRAPVAEGPATRGSLARLAAAFHDKHRQTYDHANSEEPVQLVNLRLTAIGRLPDLRLAGPAAAPARRTMREVWFPKTGSARCA